MVVMRERSGRSGRRRGSQKPGTCTMGSAALPCACALGAVSGASSTSNASASAPPRNAKTGDRKLDDIMFRASCPVGRLMTRPVATRLVFSRLYSQRAGAPHPSSARLCQRRVRLFRLEAGFLDHPLPAREVLLDEAGEPLGLAPDRVHPLADQLGAHVRLVQDAVDL